MDVVSWLIVSTCDDWLHTSSSPLFDFDCSRSPFFGHPVRDHARVVLAVAARRPEEQGRRHHLQREGDEGEVEGPAQR